MVEKFGNLAQSTLSAGITSGATTLTIVSATLFPTSGNFHIVVSAVAADNSLTNPEIMLVTGVSGSTFTVTRAQEGTTAVAHSGGEVVANVLTAAVMNTLVVGPSSAGDGNFASFDTSTGKLIKDSTFSPNAFQVANAILTTLSAYNINGLFTQTAQNVFTGRTITVGNSNTVRITNGDGVAGNPTITPNFTLFDHYADAGNVTTGETDLYSDTIAANTLANNGDKIMAVYAGIFISSATATRQIRGYFAGTQIFDTGALSISAGSDAWQIDVIIIQESSSVVRCSVIATTAGASLNIYDNYTRITGLTLSGTNILKITGQAGGVGAATNDIVAKLGTVEFKPAA